MRKILLTLLLALTATLLLTACSSSSGDASAQAVENYLEALVAKDADLIPTLVCGDWEDEAFIELDSFQAVTARLEDVACSQTGTEGDSALVNCTGNIVATYNEEDQEIDLSHITYLVVQQGSDWLVCGTR